MLDSVNVGLIEKNMYICICYTALIIYVIHAAGASIHFKWAFPTFGGNLFLYYHRCKTIMTDINGNGSLSVSA